MAMSKQDQLDIKQPKTRREEIIEKIGSCTIRDPYRWLEKNDPEVKRWVHSQHEYTLKKLLNLSEREKIQLRLEELMRVESFTIPIQKGNRYFYQACQVEQELPVLYVQEGLEGLPRVLIDQNTLSQDFTVTLKNLYVSSNGKLMLYGLSRTNNSHQSLYVMNVDNGEVLEDVIPDYLYPIAQLWPSWNQVAWTPDNRGFYYTRRPEQIPANQEQYYQKLYFHSLGSSYQEDILVFGEGLAAEQIPCPQLSPDGRYLIVTVLDASQKLPFSDIYVYDFEQPNLGFFLIIKGLNALFQTKIHRDGIYFLTNYNAPNWQIALVGLAELELAASEQQKVKLKTIIAEGSQIIENWQIVGDYILVETIENVISKLRLYDLSGHLIKEIILPDLGSIGGMSAQPEGDQLFFAFASFLLPRTVYRLDLKTQEYSLYRQIEVPFNPDLFEIKQVWYQSFDQTKVPMFLLYHKELEGKGDIPTVIFGYGGFGVIVKPAFDASIIPFLEQGGLYAIANIRGGGEFGTDWHQAGTRENKQNVFNDFIAAAEWLIAEGYTNPSRLGSLGRSNGGLLVNAVAVQRPELWRAMVAGSPVIDMARFHTCGGGKYWVADYGSPDCASDLEFLLSYSPYHNLPEQIHAPAILILVPDEDDRVAPWHGYKMFAQWQAANCSEHPILLRREENAGHRGQASTRQTILRNTDIWAFLFCQLNVNQSAS